MLDYYTYIMVYIYIYIYVYMSLYVPVDISLYILILPDSIDRFPLFGDPVRDPVPWPCAFCAFVSGVSCRLCHCHSFAELRWWWENHLVAATAFALGRRPGHGAVVEGDRFFGIRWLAFRRPCNVGETTGKPRVSSHFLVTCMLRKFLATASWRDPRRWGQGSIYHGFFVGFGQRF